MNRGSIGLLVHGNPTYHETGRQTVLSALAHTPFQVRVVYSGNPLVLPDSPRLLQIPMQVASIPDERADRFLLKFKALSAVLAVDDSEFLIWMDADTVWVRRTVEQDIEAALGPKSLGMVEQKAITGSTMNRAAFREHYRNHTLKILDPTGHPPDLPDFRYFNSGVVLGRRAEWQALVSWALSTLARQSTHLVGEHMVSDQDYFQYWALKQHADCCAVLSGAWNHCQYWDQPFPRVGVRIAHFSNFCQGPSPDTARQMKALWRGWAGWKHRWFGRWVPWKETPVL